MIMENVTRPFTYVFEDKEWPKKIALGAVFMFFSVAIIGIPFVLGYLLETIRRIRRGEEKPLPEWDNLEVKFVDGIKLFVPWAIYGVVFLFLSWIAAFIPVLGGLITTLLGVAFLVAAMHIIVHYADTLNLVESLDIRRIVEDVMRAPIAYLIAVLVALGGILVGSIGAVALVLQPILGAIAILLLVVIISFTGFYAKLAVAHAAATAYTAACGKPELLPEPEDEAEQPDQEE
jgi:hypothetical protein